MIRIQTLGVHTATLQFLSLHQRANIVIVEDVPRRYPELFRSALPVGRPLVVLRELPVEHVFLSNKLLRLALKYTGALVFGIVALQSVLASGREFRHETIRLVSVQTAVLFGTQFGRHLPSQFRASRHLICEVEIHVAHSLFGTGIGKCGNPCNLVLGFDFNPGVNEDGACCCPCLSFLC